MISVIVPIYNSEKWLGKCIKSIISQTYSDIEILLLNDGSKDKSLEICRKYEKKDNRIRVIDNENQGVSATRNLGIKEARGEFIQFVDSDDYIEPDMCEKMVNAVNECDMAICGMRIWQNGTVLREPHIEDGIYNLKSDIDIYFKLRKINLGPCNKLYRKDKITEMFKEDISLGEDTLFVLSYMKNINTIAAFSDCLYNVCLDNDNSLNRSSKLEKFDLLIKQRKTEEQVLIDIYGEKCDLTKMYEQYLLNLHAYFLSLAQEKNSQLKNLISSYVSDKFLTDKIKKSAPKRADYKIFRFLCLNKQKFLILSFFKIKALLIK